MARRMVVEATIGSWKERIESCDRRGNVRRWTLGIFSSAALVADNRVPSENSALIVNTKPSITVFDYSDAGFHGFRL